MNPDTCLKLVGYAKNRKPGDDILARLREIVQDICGCSATETQAVNFLLSFSIEFFGEYFSDIYPDIFIAIAEKMNRGESFLLVTSEELLSALAFNSVVDLAGNYVCSIGSGDSGLEGKKTDLGGEF